MKKLFQRTKYIVEQLLPADAEHVCLQWKILQILSLSLQNTNLEVEPFGIQLS